jgi:NAD+ kinase
MSAPRAPSRMPPSGARGFGKKSPCVLVVYKKSAYQTNVRERKNARFLELLEKQHLSVSRLLRAHEEHQETLEETRAALDALGARASFRFRGDEGLVEDVDLVVTVGGDGTLLWAARWVSSRTPMLAINSAPQDSVGHFCGGRKGQVKEILARALAGTLPKTELTRMEVTLDGEVVTRRVLNDVLFSHLSPAATTRYVISHERKDGRVRSEEHKSSGIWIGPAAGSTAAQLSAGGRVLPVESRRLQFVVREPYQPRRHRYRMTRGLIEDGDKLRLVSEVREGRLFIDGPHRVREVRMGSEIVVRRSREPLTLLAFPRAGRR